MLGAVWGMFPLKITAYTVASERPSGQGYDDR